MNKHSMFLSLVVATTPVAFADSANAFVPPVDSAGRPALTVCPTVVPTAAIFHFDKVIFQIGAGNLVPIIAADAAQLNALPRVTELDIKIIDNPRTVADLKGKVLSFLGAQPQLPANRQLIRIGDVEYAVVLCPKTT